MENQTIFVKIVEEKQTMMNYENMEEILIITTFIKDTKIVFLKEKQITFLNC